MLALRQLSRSVVATDRLLAVAIVVTLLEGLVRLGLALALEPYFGDIWLSIAVVAWPPVVAVIGLTAIVSTTRTGDDDRPREWGEHVAAFARKLPALTAIATVGHWVTVVVGAAVFLVIDTPLRYTLYWLGYDGLFTFHVAVYGTFVGIAVGTLLTWVVPGIAVVRVGGGERARTAAVAAITAPVARPRSVATLIGATLAFVGLAAGVTLAVARAVRWIDAAGLADGPVLAVSLAVGGLVLVFAGGYWLAWTIVFVGDRFGTRASKSSNGTKDARWAHGGDHGRRSVPVARLALACLLVTALVGTAGAVRTNEIRPVDSSPEPLPDDPDELYATALENTDRTSHEFRWYQPAENGDELAYEFELDREDRRLWVSLEGLDQYYTTGVFYNGHRAPLPGYVLMTEEGIPRLGEPSRDAEGWTVASEDDGELTLEMTDPHAVYNAQTGQDLEDLVDDPEVHESRLRMTVDTDTGTLAGGEYRLHVSESDGVSDESDFEDVGDDDRTADGPDATATPDDGDDAYDVYHVYEYETGSEVDRPDELGSAGVGEWFWRLFVY
ncbi:hypothetical protein D8Y22_03655 [Salinadaptatus halalkaliphilus]|uniref:Uncharacterized protein n=1 Tax=Salinadaptatus halalkaliphilus TaxID=2419781 RepID=A0A4S3TQX3_9EURY|nr:hypothetical protein [Salinadaptatus halalkaliphilus]THE66030.1 hypothetical protein D8Y22_03655 [Salinadaptatus halalkaliphilus]